MSQKRHLDDQDPDYEDVTEQQNKRQKLFQEGAKEATVKKIENIIRQQFALEIRNKEEEIDLIDERLNEAREYLDRLRACIVACYYGKADQTAFKSRPSSTATSMHPAVKNHLGKTVRDLGCSNTTVTCLSDHTSSEENLSKPSADVNKTSHKKPAAETATTISRNPSIPTEGERGSRFKVKKRIIIGNVSRYIPVEKRDEIDQATHKWMVYVRGSKTEPDISGFVKRVWFFLHPSYRPNDLVEICDPPFHLRRRGWGEFPVRIQLHFRDDRSKRVDLIHHLKLDRTYTGLQTLGAETIIDVELDRVDFGVSEETSIAPCSSGFSRLQHSSETKTGVRSDTDNPPTSETPASTAKKKDREISQSQLEEVTDQASSQVQKEGTCVGKKISNSQSDLNPMKLAIPSDQDKCLVPQIGRGVTQSSSTDEWNHIHIKQEPMSPVDEDSSRSSFRSVTSIKTETSGTLDADSAGWMHVQIKNEPMTPDRPSSSSSGWQEITSLRSTPEKSITFDDGYYSTSSSLPTTPERTPSNFMRFDPTAAPTSPKLKAKVTESTPLASPTHSSTTLQIGSIGGTKNISKGGSLLSEPSSTEGLNSVSVSDDKRLTKCVLQSDPNVGTQDRTETCMKSSGISSISESVCTTARLQPPSVQQTLYVKCVDETGKVFLVPQNIVIKSPTTSLSKPAHVSVPGLILGKNSIASSNAPTTTVSSVARPVQLPASKSPITLAGGSQQGITVVKSEPYPRVRTPVISRTLQSPTATRVVGSPVASNKVTNLTSLLPRIISNANPRIISMRNALTGNKTGGPMQLIVPGQPGGQQVIAGQPRFILQGQGKSLQIIGAGSGKVSPQSRVGTVPQTYKQPVDAITTVPNSVGQFKPVLKENPAARAMTLGSRSLISGQIRPPGGVQTPNPMNTVLLVSKPPVSKTMALDVPCSSVQTKFVVLADNSPSVKVSSSPQTVKRPVGGLSLLRPGLLAQTLPNNAIPQLSTSMGPNRTLLPGTNPLSTAPSQCLSQIAATKSLSLLTKSKPVPVSNTTVAPQSLLTTKIGNQTVIIKVSDSQPVSNQIPRLQLLPTSSNVEAGGALLGNKSPLLSHATQLAPQPVDNKVISTTTQKPGSAGRWTSVGDISSLPLGKQLQILKALKHEKEKKKDEEAVLPPISLEDMPDIYNLIACLVSHYPLVKKEPDRVQHPYCADSNETFLKWNIGKRRAAEWQRASRVRKRVLVLLASSSKFQKEAVPSTKQIMTWCRHHCYTPFDHETRGKLAVDAPPRTRPTWYKSPSYTDSQEIIAKLEQSWRKEKPEKPEDLQPDIDIITLDLEGQLTSVKVESSPVKKVAMRELLPATPEVEFVREAASQIGVQFRPVEICPTDLPGVFAPAAEEMMVGVVRLFAEQLLRKACVPIQQQNRFPDELTSDDIYAAIQSTRRCDFLTNQHMGVRTDETDIISAAMYIT